MDKISSESYIKNGRTGKQATLEKVRAAGITDPMARNCASHGFWVSVPGTVAGMNSVIKHFGSGKVKKNSILFFSKTYVEICISRNA
ncbi:UNVERIFIED_CONTAM: hypothetical protein NCL1_38027 [Trichonephila clavipes]